MARSNRREYRDIDGVLILDKPLGLSSNQALQQLRHLYRARKAGHCGSLDPLATGVLPICLGQATKFSSYLLGASKTYRASCRLGQTTTTGDAEGEVVETRSVSIEQQSLVRVLKKFIGEIEQVPPMYSALKKDGKRLYELARKGETVEREPRPITVHEIGLVEIAGTRLVFRVRCSKGTYVRTLVEDIARRAGTVAHTARLHRETVGDFKAADMLDLEALEALAAKGPSALAERLLPPDVALRSLPAVTVDDAAAGKFRSGQSVAPAGVPDRGLTRVYGPGQHFLGVGESDGIGQVAPRRVFGSAEKVG